MSKSSEITRKPGSKSADKRRSICPVACALDVLGDKWTLLVIRDLYMGKQTYNELQQSPENVPTNILAERLKRLHKAGIIEKKQYQQHPVRYHYQLTNKGRALGPILLEVMKWGNQYIEGTFDTGKIRKKLSKGFWL